ncbi:hypothetical protein [Rufibacter sp. LB8]|uniref:hypothetical protein n=1 Tax=Rufibacter sp. LB8 TaxID=2777781 RepID=UPI00178C4AAC|nr:hypothetical protein [Rufibacter sp. LB8]
MKKQEIAENIGAMTSLSMGLPIGLAAMVLFAMVSVIITGESMFLFGWFFTNGISTVGMLVAFIAILWFAGKMLARDIEADISRIHATFRYSTLINIVIWSVFLLIHLITNRGFNLYFGIEVPLTLAVISVLITPFTVGRWIHTALTKRLKNAFCQQSV